MQWASILCRRWEEGGRNSQEKAVFDTFGNNVENAQGTVLGF